MRCKKCNNTDIKSRRNYTHGSRSKPITTCFCKKCGSVDIESTDFGRGRRWQRR